MDSTVLCSNCGEVLEGTTAAGRTCPACGSTWLNISVLVPSGTVRLTSAPSILNAGQSVAVPPGTVRLVSAPSTISFGPARSVEIVLQAVVTYGAKTSEGNLITAVDPAWKAIVAMLSKDPKVMFNIDPRKWEEIIAAAYDEAGFDEVILTPRSGDYGRDVIAVKHGHFRVRFIDQMKAYKPGHRVTANDVRAMFGVLSADPSANKGIITTTSEFAPKIESEPNLAPFIPNRLELVDGKKLITKLNDIARGEP